jgi:hypothetical protein
VEEADRRVAGLIGQDGGEADARVMIDCDVRILLTGTEALAGAIAMDPRATLG